MDKLVKQNSLKSKITLIITLGVLTAGAQYAPAVGQQGTTAIHQDSSVIVSWASSCVLTLGYMDVTDPSNGTTSVGTEQSAIGKADGLDVVSLGDGGVAVLTFPKTIKNGTGPDFAVFENSFSDSFLELAFVEVSSDGLNYVRFPATSLTQTSTQVPTYGVIETTKLNNLAGKYRAKYGTPFDLEDLKDSTRVNINAITHVKIVDVVGSTNSAYASYDKDGNIVNDPFPTAFSSGGFDLDAVAVINEGPVSAELAIKKYFQVFPNPIKDNFSVLNLATVNVEKMELISLNGAVVKSYYSTVNLSVSGVQNGFYLLKLITSSGVQIQKVVVKND